MLHKLLVILLYPSIALNEYLLFVCIYKYYCLAFLFVLSNLLFVMLRLRYMLLRHKSKMRRNIVLFLMAIVFYYELGLLFVLYKQPYYTVKYPLLNGILIVFLLSYILTTGIFDLRRAYATNKNLFTAYHFIWLAQMLWALTISFYHPVITFAALLVLFFRRLMIGKFIDMYSL